MLLQLHLSHHIGTSQNPGIASEALIVDVMFYTSSKKKTSLLVSLITYTPAVKI
jgi:hypothetical protein